MTTESNKRLVRRFYEEIVNTGNLDRLGTFVSSDCVETDGTVRVPSGIDGMGEHIHAVREVYGDLTLTIDRQIAEGEWVVSCVTARGIHRGTWLGMKPTNRLVSFYGVNVDRVRDGKIVEHGGAANMLQPFLELGAVRAVAE